MASQKYHHCQPRFIRYPDFDRVPWVNDAIDELWPVVRDFARDFVHQARASKGWS